MPRIGSSPFAFPDFRGATRRLVYLNLFAFFALCWPCLPFPPRRGRVRRLSFVPAAFLHGALWQPFTYSFIHPGLIGTLFELLSLWFLAGFLESLHNSSWVTGLYAVSVLGTAAAAAGLYAVSGTLGYGMAQIPLYGCMGGIFGLLVAIGALYGDLRVPVVFHHRHQGPLPGGHLCADHHRHALRRAENVRLCPVGRSAGWPALTFAWPRAGAFPSPSASNGIALRNRYYRWKRRRAARKFEVYMRSQGRTVRFDGYGRPIDDEDRDDKKPLELRARLDGSFEKIFAPCHLPAHVR